MSLGVFRILLESLVFIRNFLEPLELQKSFGVFENLWKSFGILGVFVSLWVSFKVIRVFGISGVSGTSGFFGIPFEPFGVFLSL